MDKKKLKTLILPFIAVIAISIAAVVVLVVPKAPSKDPVKNAETVRTGDDRIVIEAGTLSHDNVSFIRTDSNSRIELLARIGDDGQAKVALGTCQSCNGSPGAYYTQEGDELKCNNCGLTFPISVIDSPGGGCHPIMIDGSYITYNDGDIVIDAKGLSSYEDLFAKVAEH